MQREKASGYAKSRPEALKVPSPPMFSVSSSTLSTSSSLALHPTSSFGKPTSNIHEETDLDGIMSVPGSGLDEFVIYVDNNSESLSVDGLCLREVGTHRSVHAESEPPDSPLTVRTTTTVNGDTFAIFFILFFLALALSLTYSLWCGGLLVVWVVAAS
jgi:hypothetical protein